MNTSSILIKPEACSRAFVDFVGQFLTEAGATIEDVVNYTCFNVHAEHKLQRHYGAAHHLAMSRSSEIFTANNNISSRIADAEGVNSKTNIFMLAAVQTRFHNLHGEFLDQVITDGRIVTAHDAMILLGNITPAELEELWWSNGTFHGAESAAMMLTVPVQLFHGCHVAFFPQHHVYIINGYYPAMFERMTLQHRHDDYENTESCAQHVLITFSWPESRYSWKEMQQDVLGDGDGDGDGAHTNSLRTAFLSRYEEWNCKRPLPYATYGFESASGPLEALAWRCNWNDCTPTDDDAGRYCLQRGVSYPMLRLLINKNVLFAEKNKVYSPFDLTMMCQTSSMLPILLHFQERLSSTHQIHIASNDSVIDSNTNSKDVSNDKTENNLGQNGEEFKCVSNENLTKDASLIVYSVVNCCKDKNMMNMNNEKNSNYDSVPEENVNTLFDNECTEEIRNHMVVFAIENAYNNNNDTNNTHDAEKTAEEHLQLIKGAIPNVTIDKEIVLIGPLMRLHSIVERQYTLVHFYACDAEPQKINVSCESEQMFQQEYDITWEEATRAGRVINAFNMLSLLPNCTPIKLYEMWMRSVVESKHGAMQMIDGCYVVQISSNAMQHHMHCLDKLNTVNTHMNNKNTVECNKGMHDVYFYDKVYLVNGFYPYEAACLHRRTTRVRCWQISWPEKMMNWHTARNVIHHCFNEESVQNVNSTTETGTEGESKHEVCSYNTPWHLYGFCSKDNCVEEEELYNCYFTKSNAFSLCSTRVHCSASPLEAMRERHIWFNTNYENDEVVEMCKIHGLSCALLLKWISNPIVSRSSFVSVINSDSGVNSSSNDSLVSTSHWQNQETQQQQQQKEKKEEYQQKDKRKQEYVRVFRLLENVQTSLLIQTISTHEQHQQQHQEQEQTDNVTSTCVSNFLHNHALVLLHPTCTNEDTIAFVLETLAKQNITVTEHNDCFTQHAQEIVCHSTNMIELCQWASCDRNALHLLFTQLHASSPDTLFEEQFHISLQRLLDENKVYSAFAFCASFNVKVDELMSKWDDAPSVQSKRGCHIAYVREFDVFVINGFVPYLQEVYKKPGARWHYFQISWPEADQSWAEVSQLVIGHREVAHSSAQSIQRVLSENWREFHLERRPCYRAQCCVSISESPLSAAMERVKWHCMSEHYNLMHFNSLCGARVDCTNSNNGKVVLTNSQIENNEVTLEHFYAEPFVQQLLKAHVPLALIAHYAYKYTHNYTNNGNTLNDAKDMWYEQSREEIKQLFVWQQSSVCLRRMNSIARRIHRCYSRNYSFVYLHGSCSKSNEFMHDMMAKFMKHGIVVEAHGSTPMSTASSHHLLESTDSELYKNALVRRACEVPLTHSQLELFELSFHMSWHTAVRLSLVMNASEAVKKFGEHELITKWNEAAAKVCLSPSSLYVAYFAEDGLYVINGFYYYKQARLYHSGNSNNSTIKWFYVSFPQVALSHHSFTQNVIGDEDPAKSSATSLRGMLWQRWQTKYHLSQPPDSIDNGIYASHSSLEAMAARCRWLRLSPLQDTLGYLMYVHGVDAALLHKIMCNPLVYFSPLIQESSTSRSGCEMEANVQSEMISKGTNKEITNDVIDCSFMCSVCDLQTLCSSSCLCSKSQLDEVCNAHSSDTNRVIELLQSWQDSYNFVVLKENTVFTSPIHASSEDEDSNDANLQNKDNDFCMLQNMKRNKLISRALRSATFYSGVNNAKQLEMFQLTTTSNATLENSQKVIPDANFYNDNTYLQTVLTINSNYIPNSRVCDVLICFVRDLLLRHGVEVCVCGKIINDTARSRMIFDTQYKTAWHYATQRNAVLSLLFSDDSSSSSSSSSEMIQESCHIAFGEKIDVQNVYTAEDMMHLFKFSAHAVHELWLSCAPIIEVAPDVFIGKVPNESCYLVNGFMPYARELFYNSNCSNSTNNEHHAFLLVRWPSVQMSYATFVREIIGERGNTCTVKKIYTTKVNNEEQELNYTKESQELVHIDKTPTLNELLQCNWRQLGMSCVPDAYMTPIEPSFTSLSALQSMQLRQLWWPVPLHLDPLTWSNLMCTREGSCTSHHRQKQELISDSETMNDAQSNNYSTLTEIDTDSTLEKSKAENTISTLTNINACKECHQTHLIVSPFIVRCALSNPLLSTLPHFEESTSNINLLSYLQNADNATTLSFLSSLCTENTITNGNTSALRNVALVVIQPHLSYQAFRNDVTQIFAKHHINIDEEGVISGSVMRERHGTHCLHFTFAAYASVHNPSLLYLTEAEEELIYRAFHATWNAMLLTETVLGAYDALTRLGHITPQTLYHQWRSLPRSQHVVLRNGTLELCKLKESDFIVINAPYPALQESYEAYHAKLHWYSISWSEDEMSWREVQQCVFGQRIHYENEYNVQSNYDNSYNTETICGLVQEHWHDRYGLQMSPDDVFSGVHVNMSALHALFEQTTLLQRPIEEHYLGQELLCRCSALHSASELQSIISVNSPLILQCTSVCNTQKQTLYEWMEKKPDASQAVQVITRIAESIGNREQQQQTEAKTISNDNTLSNKFELPVEMTVNGTDTIKRMTNVTNGKANLEIDDRVNQNNKGSDALTTSANTKSDLCYLLQPERCTDQQQHSVVALQRDEGDDNTSRDDAHTHNTLPFMNIANITAIFHAPALSQLPSSERKEPELKFEIQNERDQEYTHSTFQAEKMIPQQTEIMERIVLMVKEIQSIESLRIIGRYSHQLHQEFTECLLKHLLSIHFTEAFYALHPNLQHYLSQCKTSEITASDVFQQQFKQTFHEKWNDIIDDVRLHKESSQQESCSSPSVFSYEQVEHQDISESSISKNNVSNYCISCEDEAVPFATEQPTRVMSAWMAMQTYHLTAQELYELTTMNDGTVMWFDYCFTIHKLQHDNWDVYVVNAHFLFALQQTIVKLHLPNDRFNMCVQNNQDLVSNRIGGSNKNNEKMKNMNKFNCTQDVNTSPSTMSTMTVMIMFTVEWNSRECDWDTFCNLFTRCDCNTTTNDNCEDEGHSSINNTTTTNISNQSLNEEDVDASHLEYLQELRQLMSMTNYLNVSDGPLQSMIEREVWHCFDGSHTAQHHGETKYTRNKNPSDNTNYCVNNTKINAVQQQKNSKTPVLPDKLLRNVMNSNWSNLLHSAFNMTSTNNEASNEAIQEETENLCYAHANIHAEEVTEILNEWMHNPLIDATADFALTTSNKKENTVEREVVKNSNKDNNKTIQDGEGNMQEAFPSNGTITTTITRRRVFDIFYQQNSECILQMVCRYLLHREHKNNNSAQTNGNYLPREDELSHEQQSEVNIYDYVLRDVVNNQSAIVKLLKLLELSTCENVFVPNWDVEAKKIDKKILTINALNTYPAQHQNGFRNNNQKTECKNTAKDLNSVHDKIKTTDKEKEMNTSGVAKLMNADNHKTIHKNTIAATATHATCKFRKRLTSAVVKDRLMNAHSSDEVYALWQYYCAKERECASTSESNDAMNVSKDNNQKSSTIDFQEFKRDFVQLESYGVPLLSPQIIAIFREIEVGRKRGMKSKQTPNRMNFNEFARVLALYNAM